MATTPAKPAAFVDPDIPVGAGWRAAWSDQCTLGGGFHREISTPAPSAITYTPLEDDVPLVCNRIQGSFKMVETASEFEELFTAGGGLSMEGWGASGSLTVQATDQMKLSSTSLTVVISMRYLSEPMIMINPSDSEQTVELTKAAKDLLEAKGPDEFHKVHGTHYIAGYMKGGFLIGSYSMQYRSKETALSARVEIQGSFEKFKTKVEGHAEFEADVKKTNGYTSSTGQYFCRGWSKDAPPKLACTLGDLVAAHDMFNTQEGVKIAAILRSYRDIPQYAESRATYYRNAVPPKIDDNDEAFVAPDNYGIIIHNLNEEYARLCYLYQYLKDVPAAPSDEKDDVDPDKTLRACKTKARAAMRNFKKLLTLQTSSARSIGDIRTTLKGLEAYLVLCEGEEPASGSDLRTRWEEGYNTLYNKEAGLFISQGLEAEIYKALWGTAGETPTPLPPSVGNGWTIDTSSGNLVISYNGKAMFQLSKDSEPVGELSNAFVPLDKDIAIRSMLNNQFLQCNQQDNNRAKFTGPAPSGWEQLRVVKFA